jgi:hypothetical protein
MPSDDEFRNEVKSNVEKLLKNDGLRALLPPVSEQTLCQSDGNALYHALGALTEPKVTHRFC